MPNVSVSSATVRSAQAVCNEAIQNLGNAATKLQQRYVQAGEGWKDSKYTQLGGIIHECSTAIRNPIHELVDCLNKLKNLETVIQEYENTSL
jgi:hypothetical protein